MKKRKIDKLIIVAIISALYSFLALNLARLGFRNYDERIINYNEDSKVNYQVHLVQCQVVLVEPKTNDK